MIAEHWRYIESLLESEIPDNQEITKKEYIRKVGFHYRKAFEHGIKHGRDLK